MTTERSRGVTYIKPALPLDLKYGVPAGLTLNPKGVEEYFGRLQMIIKAFKEELNPWVKSFGGKEYSEIAAISQLLFLTLIGASESGEVRRFGRTGFPKKAHLVWRIVSALDYVADSSAGHNQISVQDVTDSDGVLVMRMIEEFSRIPGFSTLGRVVSQKILEHASMHEKESSTTFDQAVNSKMKTTGMFTAAGVVASWPYLLRTFPMKTLHANLPIIIQQAIAGSLIAQLLDDMVDLHRDVDRNSSSSLVVAALKESSELEHIRRLVAQGIPISESELLNNGLKAGEKLLQFYLSQRNKLASVMPSMINYFDHQFLFSRGKT